MKEYYLAFVRRGESRGFLPTPVPVYRNQEERKAGLPSSSRPRKHPTHHRSGHERAASL